MRRTRSAGFNGRPLGIRRTTGLFAERLSVGGGVSCENTPPLSAAQLRSVRGATVDLDQPALEQQSAELAHVPLDDLQRLLIALGQRRRGVSHARGPLECLE